MEYYGVNWRYLALSRDKTRTLEKRNKFSGSTQCEEYLY